MRNAPPNRPGFLPRHTAGVVKAAAVMLAFAGGAGWHGAAAQSADAAALFLAGKTKDCPRCDLAGASLKRRNLAGANLAGANLVGASFHRAEIGRAHV